MNYTLADGKMTDAATAGSVNIAKAGTYTVTVKVGELSDCENRDGTSATWWCGIHLLLQEPPAGKNAQMGWRWFLARWQAGRSSGHVVSQAYVPCRGSKRTLSHGVKTVRLCSVPRTARARATATSRTTRPVALTPRRDRRRLWQEKRATLRLRRNNRAKKRYATSFDFVSFSFFPLSLSLATGTGKGGYPEKDPSL